MSQRASGLVSVPVRAGAAGRTDLLIGGMTCGACANRIERKLNKLPGVQAVVNYATEKATVTHPPDTSPQELIAAIEQAGYTAALPDPGPAPAVPDARTRDEPDPVLAAHRSRMLVCAALTVPVVAMAMVPALQLVYWQWLSLTLAAPVVVWGGLPFYRAAWTNLRHGAATMDTLVSIGALSAFGWSLYALFLGGAGLPGFFHPFHFTLSWAGGSAQIYLEVAAGVVTFVLAGRYAEAKARRRSGAALRALLSAGRQGGRGAAGRARGADAGRPADGRGPVRGPAGREGRRRRRGRGGRVRARPEHDQRRTAPGGRRRGSRGQRRLRGRRRAAGRAGHPGRRGHPAGPDGRAGRGGADPQGGGAAAGRPGVRAVRAGGAHPGRGHLGVLAGGRRRRGHGGRRGDRGAHRGLPVRARAWPPRPRCWSAPAAAPSSAS